MKNVFEQIFKKDQAMHLLMAEFQPFRMSEQRSNPLRASVETEAGDQFEIDEMQIDKIYQCM